MSFSPSFFSSRSVYRLNVVTLMVMFLIKNASSLSLYQECRRTCKDYMKQDKIQGQVCQAAHELLRGEYKACQDGRLLGFEHACVPACAGIPYQGRQNVKPGDSYHSCMHKYGKVVSNPNTLLSWCRRGYVEMYDMVHEVIALDKTRREEEQQKGTPPPVEENIYHSNVKKEDYDKKTREVIIEKKVDSEQNEILNQHAQDIATPSSKQGYATTPKKHEPHSVDHQQSDSKNIDKLEPNGLPLVDSSHIQLSKDELTLTRDQRKTTKAKRKEETNHDDVASDHQKVESLLEF